MSQDIIDVHRFVCCVDSDTGKPVRIRSYEQTQQNRENIPATICQAAMATSAAPSYFEPVAVGRRRFVDGALLNNNPVIEVEEEARDLWCPEEEELKPLIKFFLSIGTGTPHQAAIPANIFKFLNKLRDLATDTEIEYQRFQNRNRSLLREKRFFRFNVPGALQNVGLDAHEKQGSITAATETYLDDSVQQANLQSSAENLNKKECMYTTLTNYVLGIGLALPVHKRGAITNLTSSAKHPDRLL